MRRRPPRSTLLPYTTLFRSNEDATAQSVSILNVSPGPADEAGQTVAITATSSNVALVPNPTVSGTGATRTLSYQPAANDIGSAHGSTTVTISHLMTYTSSLN